MPWSGRSGTEDDSETRLRPFEARLEEAVALAASIGLSVRYRTILPLRTRRPATLLGEGQVAEIAQQLTLHGIAVAVVDAQLSPVQQRNLERAWGCKVIDRTGLILEIFGARARTREGALQVELAHLDYQRTRLVRSWTHLERQRGGFGFLGGPGESQIELDRRLIGERMARIRRELEEVRRTRGLHRSARRRVPYPVVALVGYTNAGKSTLFNALTGAGVYAQDQLFATLDPTMRALKLPSGRTVILSDTVGFISDLPHELVEAFRATLEEVAEADIILHVRDAAHPESAAQRADVIAVLDGMVQGGTLDEAWPERTIEVLNKADLLDDAALTGLAGLGERALLVSALTGAGLDRLRSALDARLSAGLPVHRIALAPAEGAALAWLYAHGEVLDRRDGEDAIHLAVRLSPEDRARFDSRRAAAAGRRD
ncbi:GTPase HflX [Elioraea sp. Yellowstone]|uniref:GTPase HflX n=1 Tax=Elioraea sp. Yellowstone TaxID=2592070 RepID=UPI00192A5AB4